MVYRVKYYEINFFCLKKSEIVTVMKIPEHILLLCVLYETV